MAFECHHLNAALAESVLAKFEVKKSEPRAEERERREPPPKGLSMRSVAEGERAEGDSEVQTELDRLVSKSYERSNGIDPSSSCW